MSDVKVNKTLARKVLALVDQGLVSGLGKPEPGKMCGYILWIQASWGEWKGMQGYGRWHPLSQVDHDNFDAWLNARVTFAEAA